MDTTMDITIEEEREKLKDGWISEDRLRGVMKEKGWSKKLVDDVIVVIRRRVGIADGELLEERSIDKKKSKEWKPCENHTWRRTGDKYYRCDVCGVGGWTKVTPVNFGHKPYQTVVQSYKCPACKGETTDHESFCPNCLEKGESGKTKSASVLKWDELTPREQEALNYLEEKKGESTVPRGKGASLLSRLAYKGFVLKVGDHSGQTVWGLTEQGWEILKKKNI